jgi:hypothetical protein
MFLESRARATGKADNLTAISEPTAYLMWDLQHLISPGAYTACYWESFTCYHFSDISAADPLIRYLLVYLKIFVFICTNFMAGTLVVLSRKTQAQSCRARTVTNDVSSNTPVHALWHIIWEQTNCYMPAAFSSTQHNFVCSLTLLEDQSNLLMLPRFSSGHVDF